MLVAGGELVVFVTSDVVGIFWLSLFFQFVVVVEIIKLYLVQTGRFSATTGYVAFSVR